MFWDFFWFLLILVYIVSYAFVLVFVVIDLFRDDSVGGGMKALWVFFLIFLPVLTALIYLLTRGSGMAARANAGRSRPAEDDSYRPAAASDPAAEIASAKALLDAGTITQGEFDALKSKALGNQYFG